MVVRFLRVSAQNAELLFARFFLQRNSLDNFLWRPASARGGFFRAKIAGVKLVLSAFASAEYIGVPGNVLAQIRTYCIYSVAAELAWHPYIFRLCYVDSEWSSFI